MVYRREIDGLRALAILPVVLFHAGFRAFSGGFVGVDVFFVISGYLITSIIAAELESGTFSLVNFYERRARRIMPALYLVLAASFAAAWIYLSRIDLVEFSRSLVAVTVFLSNIFFWRDGGYFETDSNLRPLLHTWSLAVEEQYYLLFPLFLMIVWRLGKRRTRTLLVVGTGLSLVAAQWGSVHSPTASFFMLPFRAWELAVGALIALYSPKADRLQLSGRAQQSLSIAGFLLIAGAVYFFDKDTPLPGVYALVPTLGTALIILCAGPKTLVGALLGTRLFVGIGLISYSAYLWHQPLFALVGTNLHTQRSEIMLALSGMTFVLAFMSWKFVEQPFRNRRRFSRSFVFVLSGLGIVLFLSAGLISASLFGSASEEGEESTLARSLTEHGAVFASNMDERSFIRFRIRYENLTPDVLVIGSSRAMQIGRRNFGEGVLNLSVSGAAVEDDIAIADLAVRRFNPKTILIGADPWLFNSESGQDRWRTLDAEYRRALASLKTTEQGYVANAANSRPAESHFLRGLERFYETINREKVYAEDDNPDVVDKILRDGSRVYNIVFSRKSPQEIERGFGGLLDYGLKPYQFSNEISANFESFLAHYHKTREVVLVLSPYHPDLYEQIKTQRSVHGSIEKEFREMADRLGIRVIGSFDPKAVGCSSADFYDGMHPKESCMTRVLQELKTQQSPHHS